MGLYDGTIRDDLDAIRRVRNVFAHALKPISFATPEVADEVRKIASPRAVTFPSGRPIPEDARNQFMSAAVNLLIHLLNEHRAFVQ